MAVFESEDAATASMGVGGRVPQGVTLEEIEVREVVATA
jgi:hypothetical protein